MSSFKRRSIWKNVPKILIKFQPKIKASKVCFHSMILEIFLQIMEKLVDKASKKIQEDDCVSCLLLFDGVSPLTDGLALKEKQSITRPFHSKHYFIYFKS